MDEIVLHQAFVWDCPDCGAKDNFVKAVEAELTDAEKAALKNYMVGDDGAGEEWKGDAGERERALAEAGFVVESGLCTTPPKVTCPKCGAVFKVFIDPEAMMPPGFDPHRDLGE